MVIATRENIQGSDRADAAKESFLLVGFRGNQSSSPIFIPAKFIPMPEQGGGMAAYSILDIPAEPTISENPDSDEKLAHQLANLMLHERLSRRELEVVSHIAEGATNKEIAREMSISQQTVKNFITSIMRKLDAKNRAHVVTMAIRKGLVSLKN